MIIKDVDGGKLELTKTRLTEKTQICCEDFKGYFLYLKDLKNARQRRSEWRTIPFEVRVQLVDKRDKVHTTAPWLDYDPDSFRIGCRTFSPRTFALILKAAGIKKAGKRA